MKKELFFSKVSDEWPTPDLIYRSLNAEFGFTLDPCATTENAKAERFFVKDDKGGGLTKSWSDEVVFMNPPYSEVKRWMGKAHGESRDQMATVVALVPSRTDTDWWHRFAMPHEIRFYRGRLTFGKAKAPAPFPSAIIVMRPSTHRILTLQP